MEISHVLSAEFRSDVRRHRRNGRCAQCVALQPGPSSGQAPATSLSDAVALVAEGPSVEATAVVDFWREAGPGRWFAKDAEFDRQFRERFLSLHEAADRGELVDWLATPHGALALVLLLDQFPRNSFRNTPRMYDTDTSARAMADAAVAAGHDLKVETGLRVFFYIPFGHSEHLADQERSVMLNRRLGEPNLTLAERHRDIIRRFGRFPHRNPILGRPMRPEEQEYLDEGGFAG
jgi:uncharacterized protein (DUF924 family)